MRDPHSDNQIRQDTWDMDKQEGDTCPMLGEPNVHMQSTHMKVRHAHTKSGNYK